MMGMTKLPLDRRFREWANRSLQQSTFASTIAAEDMGFNNGPCRESEAKMFNKFADEIERDYAIKPVDVNGKAWEIGDECIIGKKKCQVAGYGDDNCACVWVDEDGEYCFCNGKFIERPKPQSPIEKLRDEIASYAHSYVPDSVLDGWVKDLDAYIDQQGKDE